MRAKTLSLILLAILLTIPMPVLAYPGFPGPHGEADLDYNGLVDVLDMDLQIMFMNGSQQPTQDQFFRAELAPWIISGGEHVICPQGDGVLESADEEPLIKVMSGDWFFSSLPWCAYDFDHDGYVDDRSPDGDDCDDTSPNVHPGIVEECGKPTCSDGLDNDCDGLIDASDLDCKQWCSTAAEASTIATASSSSSNPMNFFAVLVVPVAAVLISKGLRHRR
jgi:hypothetical protein